MPASSRIALVLGCLALAAAPASVSSAADARGDLSRRLEAALRSPALRGARIGVCVRDAATGAVLFERDADRLLVPASNLKLATAAAALSAFGPTHRFTTELSTDAPLDAQGRVDWLYLRGGGDPALTSEDFWRLAADLRRSGLAEVRRGLVLDDAYFDAERWHPSWGVPSSRAYNAPIGAITVNYGAFAIAVAPGSAGGAPIVRSDPPSPYFEIENRVARGQTRAHSRIHVDLGESGVRQPVRVAGTIAPRAEAELVQRSVQDPTRYAAAVLRMQLDAVGIRVGPELALRAVPADAVPLQRFPGRALSEVVRLFLKYSNNQIGEALVKQLGARAAGAPGSWAKGMPALLSELRKLGLDPSPFALRDGSGLSYDNRASARFLTQVVERAMHAFRFGPEFVAALPIAHADGTLAERAEGAEAKLRAKTGLLTRVTGLSGVARLADGRDAVFSILVNGFRSDAHSAMRAVDAFAAELTGG
jgi:D-alanyl-D-alanine carboxypeptidase/D-alanyl-D-alanine-endopeptidase (penicillin-binding protein 4)